MEQALAPIRELAAISRTPKMKKIFLDFKTFVAELIGLFGGFFWAKSTNWDYEPLILFIISLASLLISILFYFFYNNKEKTLRLHTNDYESILEGNLQRRQKDKITSNQLDAKTIQAEINKVQPYLKNHVESSYIGMSIEWTVKFDSIRGTRDKTHHVTTRYKGNYPWVYFDIDIEKYPIFKIAKKNQPFYIEGKIKSISGNAFTIDIEEIHEPK